MQELIFLKLGGSLITDKSRPYTPRPDVLARLAAQIAAQRESNPNLRILLGHGSGSFGHTAAKKYGTREGLLTPTKSPPSSPKIGKKQYWQGFAEVWYQASRLNRFVLDSLHEASIPGMTFSPAASVWGKNGKVLVWDVSQIEAALEKNILPVVHGDVIFDRVKGGTIFSTEELFEHLARELHPRRILLAGLEDGVYADFPARREKVRELTRMSYNQIRQGVGSSQGADVTGGMLSKVEQMLNLAEEIPDLSIQIFSGEKKGNLEKALKGAHIGTIISA
jgi:isopentenyl phosphate kinase